MVLKLFLRYFVVVGSSSVEFKFQFQFSAELLWSTNTTNFSSVVFPDRTSDLRNNVCHKRNDRMPFTRTSIDAICSISTSVTAYYSGRRIRGQYYAFRRPQPVSGEINLRRVRGGPQGFYLPFTGRHWITRLRAVKAKNEIRDGDHWKWTTAILGRSPDDYTRAV